MRIPGRSFHACVTTTSAAVAALVAIVQPHAANAQAIARDSAGVRIVNNRATDAALPQLRVAAQPVFRVGWNASGHLFEDIASAVILSDGKVAVADRARTKANVVVFSASGAVHSVMGRPGQGPGEFHTIGNISLAGRDTIVVQDWMQRRISLFHGSALVRNLQLGSEGTLSLLGATDDGRLLLGPQQGIVIGRIFPTPWLTVPLVAVDKKSGKADSVGTGDSEQSGSFGGRNPFKSSGFATASRGMFVVGRSDSPELRFYDATGKLKQIVRWPAARVAVHDTVWKKFEAGRTKALAAAGRDQARIDEWLAPMKAAIREPLPYFGDLRSDNDGNIWIADYTAPYSGTPGRLEEPPRRWRVISPTGEWLGAVDAPRGTAYRILAVSRDRVLTLELDADGVQAVALYQYGPVR